MFRIVFFMDFDFGNFDWLLSVVPTSAQFVRTQ
jgi:hypothetical protein